MLTEEKFIHNILFEKNYSIDYSKINYEKLIKILSANLLIPAFFFNIKRTKYIDIIPNDFLNYIKYIYEINLNRNKQLIIEIEKIKKILDRGKIDFCLLKGGALLENKIFNNIGERMIGDIDILINKEKFNSTIDLFFKLEYNSKKEMTKYWNKRHYPKLIKTKNIFAIEIHKSVTDYNIGIENNILNKKNSIDNMISVCIYNSELNNYGFKKAVIFYKSIYDFKNLMRFKKTKIISEDIYIKRFLLKLNMIGLYENNIKKNIWDVIYLKRFMLKRNSKIFYYLDDLLCKISINIPKYFNQTKEFLGNRNYRRYVFKKLTNYS